MNVTVAKSRFSWRCMHRLLACLPLLASLAPSARTQTIRVDAAPDHAVNSFRPTEALGAGLDRIPRASTDKIFTEPILKQMLSAGWQTVTYRQNTELNVEAWHWNPEGIRYRVIRQTRGLIAGSSVSLAQSVGKH
jgi:hypothetical protein